MTVLRLAIRLTAVLGLLTAPSAASAAAPSGFLGVQDWVMPSAKELQRLSHNGVRAFRVHLDWARVEPQPGARDWSHFDALMTRAAAAGVRVFPMLLGSPAWAAPEPQEPPDRGAPREAFMRFARDAVARYGPGGAFWAEHPELPVVAPTHWQVWNEPNFPAYWYRERPNAAQYVSFVKETRAAVLAADPGAKIVLAGLPETTKGVRADVFLRRIYAVRGAKAAFDVVAIHPYATDHRGVLGAIVRQRRNMRRAGDGRTPIWITEIGWSTGGRRSRFTVSERRQAKLLRSTVRAVLRVRRRHRIGAFYWFSLQDRRPYPGELNWWAIHTGLFRVDGSAKPAWRALRGYAG